MTLIISSSLALTSEIDGMIRHWRLLSGAPSLSSPALTPPSVRYGLDVTFMLLTCGGLVIKMMTQGSLAFLKQPWYMLDVACPACCWP